MKTNKNDQRGITHHLMLIGLAVVVAGAIGFAGFRIYKSKNDISAKAAGWTPIVRNTNGAVYACKINDVTNTNNWLVRVKIVSGKNVLAGWVYAAAQDNTFITILDATGTSNIKASTSFTSKYASVPKSNTTRLLVDMGTLVPGAAGMLYSENSLISGFKGC